jgi:putative transposase
MRNRYKKKHEQTPMFVYKARILPDKHGKNFLSKLMKAQLITYKFCLAEAIKRRNLWREHPSYKKAKWLVWNKKNIKDLYDEASKDVKFTEFGLTKYALDITNMPHKKTLRWASSILKAVMIQAVAGRAFRTVKNNKGQNKKKFIFIPTYKASILEDAHSEKPNAQKRSFFIENNAIFYREGSGRNKKKYIFPIHRGYLKNPRWNYIQDKNVRGINIKKDWNKYYAIITVEGKPLNTLEALHKSIGIDIGTQTSVVCDRDGNHAFLSLSKEHINDKIEQIKKINKRFSRLGKQANPDCYDEKGATIKGKRWTKQTNLMKQLSKKIALLHLQVTNAKRYAAKELANLTISQYGDTIKIEQSDFANMKIKKRKKSNRGVRRSIQKHSPSQYVNSLKNKANIEEINTYKTKLSQTCICGNIKNKGLSRTHTCSCSYLQQIGGTIHRDILSAFLINFVTNNKLDLPLAQSKWSGLCSVLANGSSSLSTVMETTAESLVRVSNPQGSESQQAKRFLEKSGSEQDLKTDFSGKRFRFMTLNPIQHNDLVKDQL